MMVFSSNRKKHFVIYILFLDNKFHDSNNEFKGNIDNEQLYDHIHDQLHLHGHDNHYHGDEKRGHSVHDEVFEEMDGIIKEERKLSRKFSGIADILEKKMEAGRLSRNRKSSLLYE